MTTPTHLITGIAIGAVATQFTEINPYLVVTVSTIFSVLPDLNLIWEKDLLKHHDDITHYPVIQLATSVLVIMLEKMHTGEIFWGMLLLTNLLIHIIMDTFGMRVGVHWLWPVNKKEFSFTKLNSIKIKNWQEHIIVLKKTKHIYLEIKWLLVFVGLCAILVVIL